MNTEIFMKKKIKYLQILFYQKKEEYSLMPNKYKNFFKKNYIQKYYEEYKKY